jgi:SAP domain-containing ribonucleoprotein
LQSILTGFKLSTAGVKADLVNRILEHQNKDGQDSGAAAGTSADDTASKTTDPPAAGNASADNEQPSSTSQAAAGAAEENVANGNTTTASAGEATSTSADSKAAAAAASTTEGAATDVVDEAGKTDKSSEAEKRKARLMRFGNNEELAKLERAEKFGTASADSISDKVGSSFGAHSITID